MPLDLPDTAQEVIDRAKTDVQRDLPGSNPFLKNSVLGALVTGIASRIFDFYIQLQRAVDSIMPDTAVSSFLERWAAIFGKQRLAATKSTGDIIAGGTVGSNIPISTLFTSSGGLIYESTSSAVIAESILTVFSLTRSGTVATLITDDPHELANNILCEVAGAVETEFNGTNILITVVDDVTITYEVTGSPTTPATGTITLTFNSAPVPMESQDFQDSEEDVNVNLDTGTVLGLQSPLTGINSEAGVGAVPIGGGTDQENDAQLRTRTLDRIQNPVAHFNVSDIVEKAKEVAGVTRVFVEEVTPAVGQVTIYFMRDNDTDPIPDAGEVTTTKDKILEVKPANTATADVIVAAPTAVPTAFTFTALSPNTVSMQTAIDNNLQQFFAEETAVGVNIESDAYRAAIQNTIDTETGDRVESFTISIPVGDIVIASGGIGTLGTVTYP